MKTFVLTAAGVTPPLRINNPVSAADRRLTATLIVQVIGICGNAVISVEATGDDVTALAYDPNSGCWAPAPGAPAAQASFSYPIATTLSAVRVRLTDGGTPPVGLTVKAQLAQ